MLRSLYLEIDATDNKQGGMLIFILIFTPTDFSPWYNPKSKTKTLISLGGNMRDA